MDSADSADTNDSLDVADTNCQTLDSGDAMLVVRVRPLVDHIVDLPQHPPQGVNLFAHICQLPCVEALQSVAI